MACRVQQTIVANANSVDSFTLMRSVIVQRQAKKAYLIDVCVQAVEKLRGAIESGSCLHICASSNQVAV